MGSQMERYIGKVWEGGEELLSPWNGGVSPSRCMDMLPNLEAPKTHTPGSLWELPQVGMICY